MIVATVIILSIVVGALIFITVIGGAMSQM